MEDGGIDYSRFTREQLLEAVARIDAPRHPIDFANLTREISGCPLPSTTEDSGSSGGLPTLGPSGFRVPLTFTGTGTEYFRIWVVHALLTVLSLGVYSGWAKVRKARWFAQHTQLLGDPFDYHGPPRRILLGRAIALALVIGYGHAFEWSPTAGLAMVGLLVATGPILYGAAQRFRLTNTSWRGLRFGFEASPRKIYAVGVPLVLVWTSGTVWAGINGSSTGLLAVTAVSAFAWPLVHASLKSLQHKRSRYGEERFAFRPAIGAFYGLYARTVGIGIAIILAVGFFGGMPLSMVSKANAHVGGIVLGAAMVGLTYIVAGSYFIARLQQLVWSRTSLGGLRFGSTIEASVLLYVVARNLVLVVLTVGLYWPFAAVAIARYRIQSITVQSDGPPPEITGQKQENVAAVGDAAFDFFGLDLGW